MFSFTSTPIFSMRATSLSMASSEMRKAGITWRTMPPRASGALKEGHGDAGAAQEVGRGHAGGAAADDGHLPARGTGAAGRRSGQEGLIALFGRHQLGGPDVYRLVVEVAHALVHAVVGADGAGDEGQGVRLR